AGLDFLVLLKAFSRASFAPTEAGALGVWGMGGVGLKCGALHFCGFAMKAVFEPAPGNRHLYIEQGQWLMGLRTAALVLLLATSMTACGGSQDKARELVEVSQLKEVYDDLVQTTMQSYSPRFLEVMDEDIRTVLEDKAPFKEMQELFIDSYAANLQADELDAAIRAHFHPEQAKSIFADTPEGRGFMSKMGDAYSNAQDTFENRLKERDPEIVEVLDEMNTRFNR
ncbi:hypothetical protein, partial [Pseudomonas sp. GM80]|uniref:hypothetical protein n=1 Tax=Pseudomonas sp. GM80 TaxID=1144339 RepID=UPI0005EB3948